MSDEPIIIHNGVPVTAAEYMRQQVEPRGLKPEHVPRVQKVIGRKQVTHVVGRTGKSESAAYHAVRSTRQFDSTGTLVGHDVCHSSVCKKECTIVLDMVSFDGCCESIPDARQCEKCLARLNGEVV